MFKKLYKILHEIGLRFHFPYIKINRHRQNFKDAIQN